MATYLIVTKGKESYELKCNTKGRSPARMWDLSGLDYHQSLVGLVDFKVGLLSGLLSAALVLVFYYFRSLHAGNEPHTDEKLLIGG